MAAQVVEINGKYVLGFVTEAEAQKYLDAEKASVEHEGSFSANIKHVLDRLKHHGIDTSQPVPEPAEEVAVPSEGSVETIVPTKTPHGYQKVGTVTAEDVAAESEDTSKLPPPAPATVEHGEPEA